MREKQISAQAQRESSQATASGLPEPVEKQQPVVAAAPAAQYLISSAPIVAAHPAGHASPCLDCLAKPLGLCRAGHSEAILKQKRVLEMEAWSACSNVF